MCTREEKVEGRGKKKQNVKKPNQTKKCKNKTNQMSSTSKTSNGPNRQCGPPWCERVKKRKIRKKEERKSINQKKTNKAKRAKGDNGEKPPAKVRECNEISHKDVSNSMHVLGRLRTASGGLRGAPGRLAGGLDIWSCLWTSEACPLEVCPVLWRSGLPVGGLARPLDVRGAASGSCVRRPWTSVETPLEDMCASLDVVRVSVGGVPLSLDVHRLALGRFARCLWMIEATLALSPKGTNRQKKNFRTANISLSHF